MFFLCRQVCRYAFRWCLNYYAIQDVSVNHMRNCGQQEITVIRLSTESPLFWKKHFRKNPLYFRFIADFEADNDIDKTHIGNKTTKVYKQNPGFNGSSIVSELDYVSKVVNMNLF